MTELSSPQNPTRFWPKKNAPAQTSIVPASDVAGQALVVVIAIMTFLASLAIGGVDLIAYSAHNWESQISREATIQVRPTDGLDIEKTLNYAVELVKGFQGVKSAKIIDRTQTERLLEPWIGTGLELKELPVPRLIVVTLDDTNTADFGMISDAIATQVPGGSFDDHRNAINRLVTMANATIIIGLVILALVISALTLTIIFATRRALSANQHSSTFIFSKPVSKVLFWGGCQVLSFSLRFRCGRVLPRALREAIRLLHYSAVSVSALQVISKFSY